MANDKIAIISDTHWGIRGDEVKIIDNTKKFLDNIFFPEIEKHSIDTIIHCGDLLDKRKNINVYTAKRLREDFLEQVQKRNLRMFIIAGNHDCYFKDTNEINSLSQVIGNFYPNISWFIKPNDVEIKGVSVSFIPWICDDNRKETMEHIQKTNSIYAFAHLELSNYEMFKGVYSSHGEDETLFSSYDFVFTGHFHTKSNKNNIHYVGAHSEFIWMDYDDPRGFHIFDMKTNELNFIKNPYSMFYKINYDEDKIILKEIKNIDMSHLEGKYVKLVVDKKENPYKFELFCEHLFKYKIHDLQILEKPKKLENNGISGDIDLSLSSFKDLLKNSIESISKEKFYTDKVENFILSLYEDAQKL